jgi:hypothetical protein
MYSDPDSGSSGPTQGAVALAVIFGVVAFWNAWMFLSDQGSKDWPTTIGTITAAQAGQSMWEGTRRRSSYQIVVRYIYDINGKYYSGETEFHNYSTSAKADADLKGYRIGTSMMVHYNPFFNFESTLAPGARAWSFVKGILFFAMLAIVALIPRRSRRRSNSALLPP